MGPGPECAVCWREQPDGPVPCSPAPGPVRRSHERGSLGVSSGPLKEPSSPGPILPFDIAHSEAFADAWPAQSLPLLRSPQV